MKNTFLFVFSFLCFLGNAVAQNMHVILLINTNENGRSVDRTEDYNQMRRFWTETAKFLEIPVNFTHLGPNDFNSGKTLSTCNNLLVGAQDLVIFYYSGHGANDKSSVWPVLGLQDKNLRMSEVVKTLKDKNPKFLMVMADCCNSYMRNGRVPSVQANPQDPKLYKDLFLNFSGKKQILISASEQGQYSLSHPKKGAFFGMSFRECFRRATDNSNPSADWENLLNASKQMTSDATSKSQVPHFDITTQASIED